jgi:hypothetical protein
MDQALEKGSHSKKNNKALEKGLIVIEKSGPTYATSTVSTMLKIFVAFPSSECLQQVILF